MKKNTRKRRIDYYSYPEKDEPMRVNVDLVSEINELFSKTKVIQKFKNTSKTSIELKIDVNKKKELLFSSFSCKIGDSIMVKSKVIKKEKATEKYNDAISKGNAAIFVVDDIYNNKFIINIGNIQPNQEVEFISEFIQLIETSKLYEFELFRNFPIFQGHDVYYQNSEIKGEIHLKTKNKICKVEKEIIMKELRIVKENHDIKNNSYFLSYEISLLPTFQNYSIYRYNNSDYISSSKIYFELEYDKPIIYSQKSLLAKDEKNYYIQYKIKDLKDTGEKPALFIFLIDQSGSMSGHSIKIASEALKLFIQSLPAKSYYQIIGFGSRFIKYDISPKEYTQDNINNTINTIKKLRGNLGGTDIYNPLKDIFNNYKMYEKLNLPKNIFLLTDGEIEDKSKTLKLIEENSSKFSIFSIGIGSSFDRDLIKNAGVLGKGNYNFCPDLDGLNTIIANEVSRAISPFISKIKINSSLDNDNIIKNGNSIPCIMRENEIVNLNFVINDKNLNKNDAIKIDINYLENEKEEVQKKYEISPEEIPEGEELSKLIFNNYILNSSHLSKDDKIKLALKHQILIDDTSLFAEIELSDSVSKEMKTIIIDNKKSYITPSYFSYDSINYGRIQMDSILKGRASIFPYVLNDDGLMGGLKGSIELDESLTSKKRNRESENKKEKKKDLDVKEKVMNIIKTQNFVEGFWDENKETKAIKDKYKNEYNLLKGLKNINIDDKIAMTIIIIYFIYKEHSELLEELSRIIKKAKIFIEKKTKTSYDNLIKEIKNK